MTCARFRLPACVLASFLTCGAWTAVAAQSVAQWDFDGFLEATTENEDLLPEIVAPAFEPQVDYEELEIDGELAEVARFTQGTVFRMTHGLEPNGGGVYVNQYTLILDVMYPEAFGKLDPDGLLGTDGWQCLYQTNESNSNDADWCVQSDASGSGIGISGNYGGNVADDEWHAGGQRLERCHPEPLVLREKDEDPCPPVQFGQVVVQEVTVQADPIGDAGCVGVGFEVLRRIGPVCAHDGQRSVGNMTSDVGERPNQGREMPTVEQ